MENKEKYYNNTETDIPHENVKTFIEKIECSTGKAIELGCGVGRDTVYLIKNKWNVTAIDREDVEERIKKRLNTDELKRFIFKRQEFENIEVEKNNLVIANFSLPFCNPQKFKEFWNKISNSIISNGYFVGNFFGDKDEWKPIKPNMIFLEKEEVLELFKQYDIIRFKEIEKDGTTGMGKIKHWHLFDIIARKK